MATTNSNELKGIGSETGSSARDEGVVVKKAEEEGFERAGNDAFPYRSLSSPPALPPPSNVLLPDRKFRPESDLARKRQG